MNTRALALALFLGFCPLGSAPQTSALSSILVKAGRLLDVRKGAYLENAGIWIAGQRIKEVGHFPEIQAHVPKEHESHRAWPRDSRSRSYRLPYTSHRAHSGGPDGYTLNLATKSQAFRALEGAYNARITLEAGFTSVRDVENEGAGYADVALRDAIEQGLAEGPRMQVATRAIAAVGQYNPFGISPDLSDFPTGAQMVSGQEDTAGSPRADRPRRGPH